MRKNMVSGVLAAAVASTFATTALAQNFAISIGVRETNSGAAIGANGGTTGGIEWINLDGLNLVADGTWQLMQFNFGTDPVTAFAGATANGVLDGNDGVLEHIRFRNIDGVTARFTLFVDDFVNTVNGTPTTIEDFEAWSPGQEVMIQEPSFSGSTNANLVPGPAGTYVSQVTDSTAHTGVNSYSMNFEFVDSLPTRWVRLTTFNQPNRPNPAIVYTPGSTLSFWAKIEFEEVLKGWQVDADGNWNDANNWLDGEIPNANTASAVFGRVTPFTAPRTINVDGDVIVNNITIDSAQSVTISGGSFIFLDGPAGFDASITVDQGNHTISAPMAGLIRTAISTAAGSSIAINDFQVLDPTTIDLVKSGDGKAIMNRLELDLLTVSGGELEINNGQTSAIKLQQHSIAGGLTPTATLDIGDNGLILDYDLSDDGTGNPVRANRTAVAAIQIAAAYNGGAWDGFGITSNAAAANGDYGLGIVDNALLTSPYTEFLGVGVDPESTLIRYTRRGDADLNGIVEFNDLLALARNFDPAGVDKRWLDGDSNYDGVVDFTDLLAVARNFGQSALTADQIAQIESTFGAATAADIISAFSVVPEPATLSLVAGAALLGLRRRR